MARARVCKECGTPYQGPPPYCPRHASPFGGFQRQPVNPIYRDPRWRKLAARTVQQHVARYGWVCPGWKRPPHPSRQLSADHRVALAAGGEPFEATNVGVLCRSCNTAKGKRAA